MFHPNITQINIVSGDHSRGLAFSPFTGLTLLDGQISHDGIGRMRAGDEFVRF
ncbi:MAG TPA: hypothetical protein VIW67_22855 [Terriglobales bacterium]